MELQIGKLQEQYKKTVGIEKQPYLNTIEMTN
jgi:hypothetical protein